MTAANWHPDPTGRHELRYWDGAAWTDHVSDRGNVATDPLHPPAQFAQSAQQPTPAWTDGADTLAESQQDDEQPPTSGGWTDGTETTDPTPELTTASSGAPAYNPDAVPTDAFAGISGELIDGTYSEVSGSGPVLQNKKMLRVRLDQPFLAKQGAMVAYQGTVDFAYQGGGATKFLKKALTGEGLSLMRVAGQGDVFLADEAHDVHILQLADSGLSVNGKNVLAFSESLDWNVERVRGGSMAAGGLFNTTLRGTGWVAITTDGQPVVLNAQEAPTYADANALVAWSVHLQTSLRSTMTAGALIGRGSGEAFQVSFQGPGFVIVQPSEGATVPSHTH
ncbi:AIM24 family protein [Nocardioides montaniterrae]